MTKTVTAALWGLACSLSMTAFAHDGDPSRIAAEDALTSPRAAKGAQVGAALFEVDPKAPTVLSPGSHLKTHGHDRLYFEKMARPPLPAHVLDAMAANNDVNARILPPPTHAPGFQNAVLLDGNILVVEGSEGASVTNNGETTFVHGQQGMSTVVNAAWQTLGDEFDFITTFTSFNDDSYAAYYLPLQNDVEGLGDCNFQAGDSFGCQFQSFNFSSKLQGFVFMNGFNTWQGFDWNFDGVVHSHLNPDSSIYSTLGQEIAHRWLAALRFKDPFSGATSKKLLGRDNSHWAGFVDTDGSVMDGWDWIVDGQEFKALGAMDTFWGVDLYAMGALSASEVPPFFYINDARFVPNGYVGNQQIPATLATQFPSPELFEENNIEIRATGTKVELSMADIIAAEGMRCPTTEDTQRTFRQLFVLVTRPGQTKAQVAGDIAKLEEVRVVWEEFFSTHTRNRLRICTELGDECLLPTPVLGRATLGGGDVVNPGSVAAVDVRLHSFDAPIKDVALQLGLAGEGADFATLASTERNVGNLLAVDTWDERVDITFADDYPCGAPLIVDATYTSSNAETKTHSYMFHPGMTDTLRADFDVDDAGFSVEGGGASLFTRAFIKSDCDSSAFSPADDASAGRGSAFITGLSASDIGIQSIVSPNLTVGEGALLTTTVWVGGDASLDVSLEFPGGDLVPLTTVAGVIGASWTTLSLPLAAHVSEGDVVRIRFNATGGDGEIVIDDFAVKALAGACVTPEAGGDGDGDDDSDGDDALLASGCGGCASTRTSPEVIWIAFGLVLFAIRRRR